MQNFAANQIVPIKSKEEFLRTPFLNVIGPPFQQVEKKSYKCFSDNPLTEQLLKYPDKSAVSAHPDHFYNVMQWHRLKIPTDEYKPCSYALRVDFDRGPILRKRSECGPRPPQSNLNPGPFRVCLQTSCISECMATYDAGPPEAPSTTNSLHNSIASALPTYDMEHTEGASTKLDAQQPIAYTGNRANVAASAPLPRRLVSVWNRLVSWLHQKRARLRRRWSADAAYPVEASSKEKRPAPAHRLYIISGGVALKCLPRVHRVWHESGAAVASLLFSRFRYYKFQPPQSNSSIHFCFYQHNCVQ